MQDHNLSAAEVDQAALTRMSTIGRPISMQADVLDVGYSRRASSHPRDCSGCYRRNH
jgi:hypothetical protein